MKNNYSTANPLHELATELCLIVLCCDALRRNNRAAFSKEEIYQIGRIELSADRIRALLKQLTDSNDPTTVVAQDEALPL